MTRQFVPGRFRDAWYRRALALQELLGYNADVMCLQEVDERALDRYLLPLMRLQGAPVPYCMAATKLADVCVH